VLLPGSEGLATFLEPDLVAAAVGLTRGVGRIASICTGAFLLAATAAGRAPGHHALAARRDASPAVPRITVELDAIFVTDGPIATSAGVTAGIDLTLALVEDDTALT